MPTKLAGHRDRHAPPRPDAARAQRAARGRVLLEVTPPHDRVGERPDRARRARSARRTASTRPARCAAGYGVTLGNALRRVLLSSLEGAAVTSVQVRDVYHEFSSIPGVKEDVIQIVLNLKKLRLKSYVAAPDPAEARQVGAGPVTAADIMESADVEIVNPDQHLLTLELGRRDHRDGPHGRARRRLPRGRASRRSCPSGSSRSTPSSRPCARSTTTSRTRASAR